MSDGKTWKRFRKMDVFGSASKSHLGGFNGDKKGLEDYLRKKGSKEYSDLIDPVVNLLVNRGFVKRAVNPAEIIITEEGVTMCNKEHRYRLVFPRLSNRLTCYIAPSAPSNRKQF